MGWAYGQDWRGKECTKKPNGKHPLRKMTAFWDTALYSLVKVDWHFIGAYCLHH
jgi:hypothetical protein